MVIGGETFGVALSDYYYLVENRKMVVATANLSHMFKLFNSKS